MPRPKARQRVVLSPDARGTIATMLFRQPVPENILVRENPRTIVHHHSYGSLSRFFMGLSRGMLLGTTCDSCDASSIWLPPRAHCPDCWEPMQWVEIDTSHATVYTYSMTNFPGAGFKATTPCPLISVALPGVCTKFMSYLSEFGEGEPYIGMPIRPVFNKKNPTFTILDISWIPKRNM